MADPSAQRPEEDARRAESGGGGRKRWSEDLTLVARARGGDAYAREQVLTRFERMPAYARSIHRRLSGSLSSDELDDVAQEAVVAAWRKLGEYAGEARLDTWIYRFAHYEVLKALQRRGRRGVMQSIESRHVDEGTGGTTVRDTLAVAEKDELSYDVERLTRVLAEYDPGTRRLILMKVVEERSFREISEAMGQPFGTVRNRFYRAIERLRGRLGAAEAGGRSEG